MSKEHLIIPKNSFTMKANLQNKEPPVKGLNRIPMRIPLLLMV